MKTCRTLILVLTTAICVMSCTKPENPPEPVSDFSVSPTSISFTKEGGSQDITLKIGGNWESAISASWLTLSQMGGGTINGTVRVTASVNMDQARTATITFTSGKHSATVSVSQEKGYADDDIKKVSIAEFRKLKDSSTDWYRIAGEVVSISKEEYGDLYLLDDTGYIYVYGLAPQKGGASEDFPKLGVKAGDKISIIAHKTTHNGLIETGNAYLELKESGSYPGIRSEKASAGYIELPATSEKDGLIYVCHYDGKKRNFSAYFDTQKRLSAWVCYPYCSADKNDARPDSYAYDPLIESEFQADLTKSYQKRTFDGEEFIRGHMMPNASRGGRRQLDAFLSTNIMPQSSSINTGIWSSLEGKEREWLNKCDTLYVVVGTDSSESKYQVEDNASTPKKITVPNGIYRAVLAFSKKDNSYKGIAAYFDNKKNSQSSFSKSLPETMLMSIDQLEEKLGTDFFVNLPADVQKTVEAQDPRTESFWW